MRLLNFNAAAALVILAASAPFSSALGQTDLPTIEPTYADLADQTDASQIVLIAEIRKQVEVGADRAPGLQPNFVRLYIEARTIGLLTGTAPVGESLRYLVDMPRNAKGKAPKLRKSRVILFARPVPGRPGELQLATPSAQIPWTPDTDARLRPILAEFVRTDAAPQITGIREAMSIEGNLAGESETQLFLSTQDDGPVSITVIHRPGQRPIWGVSWTEIVDQAARPPEANTIDWYRLACFLPDRLPAKANISAGRESQSRAAADYQFVLNELGRCPRNLPQTPGQNLGKSG